MSTHTQARKTVYESVDAVIAALKPSYPIYCVYPDRLRTAARRFLDNFQGNVLFAVKCNPEPLIIDTLYAAGLRHFDTASLAEIALISERYPDAKSYFQNPVKSPAAIEAAYRVYGVRDFVLDHPRELTKLIECTHGARDVVAYVRIATPPGSATYDLSSKFGVMPDRAPELLRAVADAGFQPAISFHVGSQCLRPDDYTDALALIEPILAKAKVSIVALDVGGGFPGHYRNVNAPPLDYFFQAIKDGVHALRLDPEPILLCEPGRALVVEAISVIVQVLLRKEDRLYINDGIFGSFSEFLFERIEYPARVIRAHAPSDALPIPFAIFGPTCDSNDKFPVAVMLPGDIREGDWIVFGMLGAYSNAVRTHFNGFYPETFVEIHEAGR